MPQRENWQQQNALLLNVCVDVSMCVCESMRECASLCVWAKRGLRLGVCFVPTAMTTCTNFTSSST